jgi:hypothetical protein
MAAKETAPEFEPASVYGIVSGKFEDQEGSVGGNDRAKMRPMRFQVEPSLGTLQESGMEEECRPD